MDEARAPRSPKHSSPLALWTEPVGSMASLVCHLGPSGPPHPLRGSGASEARVRQGGVGAGAAEGGFQKGESADHHDT